ncbi:MAG: chromate resistance protein [Proteobacteria bacterium]|nr:chromate resistance protein [Pseudomonadota bacterium]
MKKSKLIYSIFISLFVFIIFVSCSHASAGQKHLVFSTCEGFEVDKCASIWLIKRFIDKNAEIKFFPKGETIKEGILFDTPEAKFRRYFNMSTFESLLLHYNIKNAKAVHIGKIIHDIEVNTWERKVMNETISVKDTVNRIILEANDSKEIIERCNSYFDALYEE